MPTYYARASGNVNANNVWATTPGGTAGAQTFVAGDVLVANSFTITLNVDTNLGSTGAVRNDATGGATAGGSFSLSNNITLTANIFAGTVATACVTLSGSASATIVGAIFGGTVAGAHGVNHTSGGTLTVTGSVTGGSGTSGSNGSDGILQTAGTLMMTGTVTGGTVAAGNNGIQCASSCTITGTVFGGSITGADGLFLSSGGSGSINGAAVGATAAGANNGSTGTLAVTRAKGGPLASSAVGVIGSTTGSTSVEEIEYGDLGASPTSGPIRLTDKSSNVALFYVPSAAKKTLVDANASGLMPAASNVRSGTVYNGGNSTGTCAVPAASSVAFGVPVDATTGTAALTPAAVWDYLTASASTANSMGERLRNAATVASTGQALADALTP